MYYVYTGNVCPKGFETANFWEVNYLLFMLHVFLRACNAVFGAVLLLVSGLQLASCGGNSQPVAIAPPRQDATKMVTYPEKAELLLRTDRPPQLETPLEILKQDITPNKYFFVRWHLSQLVTSIDADTFRLRIGGAVNKEFSLSLSDLKTKFQPDSVLALAICVGNSRSSFIPRVPGTQWKNGAMGNAWWKGVKVKDLLAMAGVKKGAVDVSFQGMDKSPMPGIPAFAKSLALDHAMDGEVLLAYEMNGDPIPLLNGYPLKLVVPGWYATYWVGAVGTIQVHDNKFAGFWMEKAYKVTADPQMNESPLQPDKNTVPVTKINLHSIFVAPAEGDTVAAGTTLPLEGLAYDDGAGIEKVELSTDSGATWVPVVLQPPLGKYSWRRWRHNWAPPKPGRYHLAIRATNAAGKNQVAAQWNKSGYGRGFIEHLLLTAK